MKTHDFDAVSFFTGLVFAAIGLLFLVPTEVSSVFDVLIGAGRWFWPVLLLAVGAAVLVPAVRKTSSKGSDSE